LAPSQREAKVLRELPTKVGFSSLDEGVVEDTHYFVTDWFEVRPVKETAKRVRQHLTTSNKKRLLTLVRQCAELIDATHRAGWVHGDVQPSHFIETDSGDVRLVDWALARRVDNPEQWPHSGSLVHYSAPEIAEAMLGRQKESGYGVSSEIYSLCATLFMFFTGKTVVDYGIEPQGEERFAHRLRKIISETQKESLMSRLDELPSWIPSSLCDAIKRGLSFETTRRPSANDILMSIPKEERSTGASAGSPHTWEHHRPVE
ncbi:MAG: protein kinase, partial [Myxococcota bacterium]